MKARVIGKRIFEVIDRKPKVNDDEADKTHKQLTLQDGIHFKNVRFRYPTAAPSTKDIMERGNFKIIAGESTAIVGPSGSGKSTIVQMIERFYDPIDGQILLDEEPLTNYSLAVLRESIGYVG